jgi:hypothetical protein
VQGDGPFPLDMLRVMRSWPRENVYAGLTQDEAAPRRYVHLATPWKPSKATADRWMGAGWSIVESNRVC